MPPSESHNRTDHEREYSPSSRVADVGVYLVEYARRSAAARALPNRFHCLRYGPRPEQVLDYFPPSRSGAPVQVFVHGGYWQELSRHESSFAAPGLLRDGAGFVALGYGLAPKYSLDEIVTMVREGLWWLVRRADELPGRPGAIHLSGSSAGAHLVTMALLDGWLPAGVRPVDVFASATLLSGIYDLRPLLATYVNDALGLDTASARPRRPGTARSCPCPVSYRRWSSRSGTTRPPRSIASTRSS
jgi:arylformamidase